MVKFEMNDFIQSRVQEIAKAALEAMKLEGKRITSEDESQLLFQVTQTVNEAIASFFTEYVELQKSAPDSSKS